MKKAITLAAVASMLLAGAITASADGFNYGFITSCGEEVYWDDTEEMEEDQLVELLEFYELFYCGISL
ncbi:MAG: hypothetical protein J6T22_03150 [Bacteroidales bacterium]|nr:hypothetical protein [Bacteroidales bacterium]